MTYQNDPNRHKSYPMNESRSYTGWIVGAVVALAVVLGIFAMTGRTNDSNTAANSPAAPTTTGSATPNAQPANPTPGPATTPAKPAAPAPATPR